jgi:hypothetical protein
MVMAGLRAALIAALICAPSCARHDRQLQDHQDAFQSLSATTTAIVDGWLTGAVSGTYTLTALDRTYLLAEQERSSLAATAALAADARGAAMLDSATALSRHIALIITAVRSADGDAARGHIADLPFKTPA